MKRYLKNDRYRLTEHEAGNLWYSVRRELNGAEGGSPRRRGIRAWPPALATVAVLAVAVVSVVWWQDGRAPAPGAQRQGIVRYTELGIPPTATQQTPPIASDAGRRAAPPAGKDAPMVAAAPRIEKKADERGAVTGSPAASARDLGSASSVVASLEPVEVTSEEYMVDVKSAVTGGGVPQPVSDNLSTGVVSQTFDKYAIDSVNDAIAKQSARGASDKASMTVQEVNSALAAATSSSVDVQASSGQLLGDVSRSAAMAAPPVAPGSVTGGTTPPNGEKYELMYFEHAGVNPFIATEDDALSTFAMDVDNASFSLARSYLDRGELPPAAAIRVEEFVNAIDAGWDNVQKETFRIGLDGGPSRFGEGYHLLRVGVVGRSVDNAHRKAANLVFVIDTSGSMGRENRLESVKRALRTLVDELGEGDRVGIVTYGSQAEVRLPLTDVSRRREILGIIQGLHTDGSTNVADGLRLGYGVARRGFDAGLINRLVLCSDGVANTGSATDAEGILELARRGSDDGITLSAVGFGMGNYNDVLMEKLADQGDGNYFYVDGPREAERVFRENLTGMLQTIARQAKVQVEFDPERVSRWRLLGYENRDVADRDFRNDAVDAGEVGAGHQVTALYEVKLVDGGRGREANEGRIGVVRLRWEAPEHDTAHAGKVTEIERPIDAALFAARDGGGSAHRRAQVLAAEFAEILRGSYWAKESRFSSLVPLADGLAAELPREQAVQDLARMIRRAADLAEGRGRIETMDEK
jgi:Ca-activated chloride channel family protein